MKTLVIKDKHQGSVIDRMFNLKLQINYHKKEIAPYYSEMQKFEQKEYLAVYNDNIAEFEELKQYIKSKEATFNDMLSEYNFSVATFIYYLNHKLN